MEALGMAMRQSRQLEGHPRVAGQTTASPSLALKREPDHTPIRQA